MRLDKCLSQSTGLTRKETKQILRQGRVRVDGEVVKTADLKLSDANIVEFDGHEIAPPGNLYIMLNKPQGVICSTRDPNHMTVLDLIDEPRAHTLHPVGRLDIDTTGLVLLTDDGQWSHGITAPKKHKDKVYRVTLAEPLVETAERKLAKGIMLNGEDKRTQPAELERISDTEVHIAIHEGRYHQVKRMFAALGNHVEALHRESIGGLALDPELEPGEYRPLTEQEIESLR